MTAHPLVEITLMKQGERTLLHFVNLSGHSSTAYFAPIPMRAITVESAGEFARATAVGLDRPLELTREGGRAGFTLPELEAYELVVLEPREPLESQK